MLRLQKSLSPILGAIAVSALVLAPTIGNAAYQNCTPTRVLAPEPQLQAAPSNQLGCAYGAVIRLGDGSSVWRCTVGPDSTSAAANKVLLVSADGSSKALPDSLLTRDGLMRFSVWLIDLDDNGTEERILSYWNGRGEDGIANSWTAIVFRYDWASLSESDGPSDRNMAGASDIHDWGLGNLIKDPMQPRVCTLAISEFKTHNAVKGLKVDFFSLGGQSLTPASTLPSVFRPLNAKFKRERRKAYVKYPASGDMKRWISSTDAKLLSTQ
jgi:hypothetical protein